MQPNGGVASESLWKCKFLNFIITENYLNDFMVGLQKTVFFISTQVGHLEAWSVIHSLKNIKSGK